MSRRDTIIIAVLVNAALLMILFATALRPDSSKRVERSEADSLLSAQGNLPSSNNNPLNGLPGSLSSEATPLSLSGETNSLALQTSQTILSPTMNQDELFAAYESMVPTLAPPPTPTEILPESLLSLETHPLNESTSPAVEIHNTHTAAVATTPLSPAPAPAKTEPTLISVTVKKGDALERIARAHGTTVAAIMKASNLSSTQLKIGQVLKVPTGSKTQGRSAQPAAATSGSAEYYIVKEGDNPWLIASRNKLRLNELLRLNGLDEQKAKRLRPGDKLRIR